ncbi:deoxyribose-phosphate aldolase [Anaeromicropila populeti]|uniref:Deoxyribose-phosphate aldolase n=1 Tax=Anaeromicropila populeti TaxID=37658 RepID=A0A1I6I8M7_9FIRM|nr:deoxyribose-phosphate aldolase [Anaeromicropila populeti]SFR63031.1 deoxyribose-phosphate aldolase [Anaeromicropila populeti]
MDKKQILSMVDHTLLTQTATWDEIKTICQDGIQFGTASVCIPPAFVEQAYEFVEGKIPVCTVIGFPNGYMTKETKAFEAKDALLKGAGEIDMVINLGDVKMGNYSKILDEIRALKEVCQNKVLKVIIETCLLTDQEKIKMCEVVTNSGADFIKTSTGFSTSGATFQDVELFAKYVGKDVKIKAAGGITSFEDGRKFMELGASRLGTSRLIKIMKSEEGNGY